MEPDIQQEIVADSEGEEDQLLSPPTTGLVKSPIIITAVPVKTRPRPKPLGRKPQPQHSPPDVASSISERAKTHRRSTQQISEPSPSIQIIRSSKVIDIIELDSDGDEEEFQPNSSTRKKGKGKTKSNANHAALEREIEHMIPIATSSVRSTSLPPSDPPSTLAQFADFPPIAILSDDNNPVPSSSPLSPLMPPPELPVTTPKIRAPRKKPPVDPNAPPKEKKKRVPKAKGRKATAAPAKSVDFKSTEFIEDDEEGATTAAKSAEFKSAGFIDDEQMELHNQASTSKAFDAPPLSFVPASQADEEEIPAVSVKPVKRKTVVSDDEDFEETPSRKKQKQQPSSGGSTKQKKKPTAAAKRRILNSDDEEEKDTTAVVGTKTKKKTAAAAKRKRVSSDNEEEDQEPNAVVETEQSVVPSVVPEPESEKEQEKQQQPSSSSKSSTTKPPTSSSSRSRSVAGYTIQPSKLSMADLIRNANARTGFASTPQPSMGRQFKSLNGTSASSSPTAYSPMAKSSRVALSRIAPLHPNRRTPPPPLPRPPPPKKTKKELEREEQWEEELVEEVGGMNDWLDLTDEKRKEMRRIKREREMGGYED